jgi:hypothetical protein
MCGTEKRINLYSHFVEKFQGNCWVETDAGSLNPHAQLAVSEANLTQI